MWPEALCIHLILINVISGVFLKKKNAAKLKKTKKTKTKLTAWYQDFWLDTFSFKTDLNSGMKWLELMVKGQDHWYFILLKRDMNTIPLKDIPTCIILKMVVEIAVDTLMQKKKIIYRCSKD